MRNKSLIYCTAALMLLILSFADFMDISALNVGLMAALCALGLNAPILSVILVLTSLTRFNLVNLIYTASAGLVFSIIWLFGLKFKLKKYIYIIGTVLAQAGLIIIAVINSLNFVAVTVNIFFAFVFAYLCYGFGVPVLKNKLRYKLLDSELISGAILWAALAYGLARMPFGFPMAPIFFAVGVLAGCKVLGSGGLNIGLAFALGYALGEGTALVGAFVLMSLTALIFIPAPRILSALSLIMSFVMYTFFFNVIPDNALLYMTALLIGGAIYMLIPTKKLDYAKQFFMPDGRKALRSMVNRDRVEVGRKLEAISGVFGEMSAIMGGGNGTIADSHLRELSDTLVGSVCALCPKYDACLASGAVDKVGDVMNASLESGRATVTDLPSEIKSGCISLASLIGTAATLASGYSERLARMKNVDVAKKMVASQLGGISDILTAFAHKEAEPLRFDSETEKKIAEELTYRTVVTSEALVTGGSVMLTVLTETCNCDIIKTVLKKMLGMTFNVDKVEKSNLAGYTIVHASAKPKFDVVFSVCGCPKDKNTVSGDTHSFIRIDEHRFMMAVCDGMGSGEKASGFSSATISLIENFYKAGFSHRLVLNSVNNFLTLSSEEIYSAVDIAVVDLENGLCDIIKIGSPAGYIKTKDSVLRVDGSSLPIGVLEEMKPSIVTYPLKGGETVVLTSDGAADSFSGDGLADVVNNSVKLPEELCKRVVDAAIKNTGSPCDDITVAAFHIFEAA